MTLIVQKSSGCNILISLAFRMSCLYPGPEIQEYNSDYFLFNRNLFNKIDKNDFSNKNL